MPRQPDGNAIWPSAKGTPGLKRAGWSAPAAFPCDDAMPLWAWGALIIILGLNALQVFYRLDVPSLWLDEAAAPLHARYPLEYLVELSRTLEEHPPLFYMGVKLFTQGGHDDFRIRLLPAICGVLSTAAIFIAGRRLYGYPVGIAAAALWAASPHILWLSRIARPYIVFLLLAIASFSLLLGCLENRTARRVPLLLLVNLVMLCVHYMGAFVICSQVAAMFCWRLATGRRILDRGLVLLTSVSAVSALGVYLALIRSSEVPASYLAERIDSATVLQSLGANMLDSLTHYPAPWLGGLLLAASLVCMLQSARESNRAGILLLINALGPPALLLVLQKSQGLYPRHFSFLVIFVCLGLAWGLTRLARSPAWAVLAALAAAAGGTAWNMAGNFSTYYEEASYQIPVIGDNYKALARAVSLLAPEEILNFSNPLLGNAIIYHLDREAAPSPGFGVPARPRMRLTSDDSVARLAMLMNLHPGYSAANAADFAARYGPMEHVESIDRSTLLRHAVARTSRHPLPSGSQPFAAPMRYPDFYAKVSEAKDVGFSQDSLGPSVHAAANNTETYAGYEFDNPTGEGNVRIAVLIGYDNTGAGNHLRLDCAFDSEPWRSVPVSSGYDVNRQKLVTLDRDTPFRTLKVRAVLVCGTEAPSLDGANLLRLRLRSLECWTCPASEPGACEEASRSRLALSRLFNYRSQDFPVEGAVRQLIAPLNDNVVDKPEGERPGWSPYVPGDAQQPARLTLKVRLNKERIAFFPRLGTGSWMRVEAVDSAGLLRELFALENPFGFFTPIGARFEFIVPADMRGVEREFILTFGGPWAQLWHRGGGGALLKVIARTAASS